MKRGGPIQRKSPMGRGKPLDRGSKLQSRGPVRPKREAPRRRDRDGDDHSIPWPDVRNLVFVRSGGRCEACGDHLAFFTMQAHHRRTRRVGPDCACNALALCAGCHHGPTVHAGPEVAKDLGRIISRHSTDRPATLPVEVHGRGRVLLSCHGTYESAAA